MDNKGRVSFPAKMRKYVSPLAEDRFTILRGIDRCLYLYPDNEWETVEKSLDAINSFSAEGRRVKRAFLRSAEDVELDKQNRIALPGSLMDWAGISNKAVFLGSGDRIEIWSPENLDAEDGTLDFDGYQELFEKVLGDVDGE